MEIVSWYEINVEFSGGKLLAYRVNEMIYCIYFKELGNKLNLFNQRIVTDNYDDMTHQFFE